VKFHVSQPILEREQVYRACLQELYMTTYLQMTTIAVISHDRMQRIQVEDDISFFYVCRPIFRSFLPIPYLAFPTAAQFRQLGGI
jgi:hypothetical protein